jgi:hypothetical protein
MNQTSWFVAIEKTDQASKFIVSSFMDMLTTHGVCQSMDVNDSQVDKGHRKNSDAVYV